MTSKLSASDSIGSLEHRGHGVRAERIDRCDAGEVIAQS